MGKARLLRSALVLLLPLAGCAGPATSTTVMQVRDPNGGTVRITSAAYPPDADVQAQAKSLMSQACDGRSWSVVDMSLTQAKAGESAQNQWVWIAGSGAPAQRVVGSPSRQQVDLAFVCSPNGSAQDR